MKNLLLFLLFASAAFAQNFRSDGVVQARSGSPAPGALVAVCTQPCTVPANVSSVTPPSPLAALCSSASDVTCTSPNPVTADGLGNYHFYVSPGKYTVVFYGSGLTASKQVDQIFPCDPSNCSLPGNVSVGGTLGVNTLDNIAFVDGVHYAFTDAGIQSAINTACGTTNGTIILTQATYIISNTINITKPCSIIGAGFGTVLQVAAGVGATTDIIHIVPTSSLQGLRLQDFKITPISGTPGRNAINIDATSAVISNFVFDHLWLDTLGGKGIVGTYPSGINGYFLGKIENSIINNGILLNRSNGDLQISNNKIQGSNIGIDVTFVTGGFGLDIGPNNDIGSTSAAAIHLGDSVQKARIFGNQLEGQVGIAGSNGAYVDIDGTVGNPASGIDIYGNYMSPVEATLDTIRVNFADQTHIYGNLLFRTAVAKFEVKVTANATKTYIGPNQLSPNTDTLALAYSDSGTNTFISGFNAGTNLWTFEPGFAVATTAGATALSASTSQMRGSSTYAYGWTSGADPTATTFDTQFSRISAGLASIDTTTRGNSAAGLVQTGGIDLGTSQIRSKIDFSQIAAPSGTASKTSCYADSTSLGLKCSYNNAGYLQITQTVGTGNVTTAGTAVTNGTTQDQTGITVTGAATTDACTANIGAALPATWQTGIRFWCDVTATNTVTVHLQNPTAGSITPAATQVNVRVTR